MEKSFHRIALAEGTSFLVLLLIAMPLKYFADMPWAVKIVGWAHGVLFILYLAALFLGWRRNGWSIRFCAIAFIAAFLPAGPFFLHPKSAAAETR